MKKLAILFLALALSFITFGQNETTTDIADIIKKHDVFGNKSSLAPTHHIVLSIPLNYNIVYYK